MIDINVHLYHSNRTNKLEVGNSATYRLGMAAHISYFDQTLKANRILLNNQEDEQLWGNPEEANFINTAGTFQG